MNIQDALKETGKVFSKSDVSTVYAELNNDEVLQFFGCQKNDKRILVPLSEILRDDWQPYPKEQEIKPENAGELWESESGIKYFTVYQDEQRNILRARCEYDASWESNGGTMSDMIHNKNGWTRLFPHVEDGSIERIEIEGVTWALNSQDGRCPVKIVYPSVAEFTFNLDYLDLINKPPMKMILEIPKDKP